MDQRQTTTVFELPTLHRYEYFLIHSVKNKQVWVLRGISGFATFTDESGQIQYPVWPNKAFADAFCIGKWQTCQSEAISLDEFMDTWIPRMIEAGRSLSIFPSPGEQGLVHSPQDTLNDLHTELGNIKE